MCEKKTNTLLFWLSVQQSLKYEEVIYDRHWTHSEFMRFVRGNKTHSTLSLHELKEFSLSLILWCTKLLPCLSSKRLESNKISFKYLLRFKLKLKYPLTILTHKDDPFKGPGEPQLPKHFFKIIYILKKYLYIIWLFISIYFKKKLF